MLQADPDFGKHHLTIFIKGYTCTFRPFKFVLDKFVGVWLFTLGIFCKAWWCNSALVQKLLFTSYWTQLVHTTSRKVTNCQNLILNQDCVWSEKNYAMYIGPPTCTFLQGWKRKLWLRILYRIKKNGLICCTIETSFFAML